VCIVDEIYQGLSYDERYGRSALALDERIVSVNSFSKYFGMTGWRLGWLVLPPALVGAVERLAQNLYICPSISVIISVDHNFFLSLNCLINTVTGFSHITK
jgi:aspartate/methionine/tyrosine aminotransferase